MSTFSEYSQYYNLFYRDKNYQLEADYVDQTIKKNIPDARVLLDLGCGTGVHDRLLNKKGYEILGIDRSETMVKEAYSIANDTLSFLQGDIRKLRMDKKFDVVISLFHVMSYQVNYVDLFDSFATAKAHLKTSGLFIFDFWYGPAVLTNRPQQKTKVAEDEKLIVKRETNPKLHLHQNMVDVNFSFEVMDKSTSALKHSFNELHTMRYWFYPELEFFLNKAGFLLLSFEEWLTGKKPDSNTWNGCMIAKSE
jgi:SAM-dependent methyltransferase